MCIKASTPGLMTVDDPPAIPQHKNMFTTIIRGTTPLSQCTHVGHTRCTTYTHTTGVYWRLVHASARPYASAQNALWPERTHPYGRPNGR